MRHALTALLIVLAVRAPALARLSVASLPAGALPDPEAATNLPLRVDAGRLRSLALSVSFASCATNEVLVAIGADADGDGDLSPDEAAVVLGCDCGAWYRADLRTGEAADAATNALVLSRRAFDPSWDLVKVVRRGLGEVGEAVAVDEERVRFDVRIR